MARIRTIKPDFWKHEELSELPEATHMLAAALLNYADDEGYFNANPQLVKSECFPLREPSVSIHDSLTKLQKIGWVRLGTAENGRQYGHVITFLDHQVINRKTPSKIRCMRIVWEELRGAHSQLSESSHLEKKGREEEAKGNEIDGADDARAGQRERPAIPKEAELEFDPWRAGQEVR